MAQVRRIEERHLVERLQPLAVIPEPPQLRLAIAVDLADPAEMIQAEVIEERTVALQIERVRDLFEELGWRVADPDHPRGDRPHRLRNHADRVREVDDPGAWRGAGDRARVLHHVRDRARRHRKPRRTDRLLTGDTVRQRDGLVADPVREAADANAGEDEVGARHAIVERRAEHDSTLRGHPRGDAANRRQAVLVDVIERDLVDRQIRSRQTVHEQRCSDARATDHRDFHERRRCPLSGGAKVRKARETAGFRRRRRADDVATAQTVARRPPLEEARQEAAVEGVAGAGSVDDADTRCGNGDVNRSAQPSAAACSQLDDRGSRPSPRARIQRRLRCVHEHDIESRDQAIEPGARANRWIPAEVPRRGDAARAQTIDEANPAIDPDGREGEVHMARTLAAHRPQQPRLELHVDAVEGDEAPLASRRQRGRDRMRFVRSLDVGDVHALGAQVANASGAESADDAGRDAQPGGCRGGDHRPAADRRQVVRAPQFLAGFRQARQARENQILERFADDQQIDPRHAKV